MGVTQGTWGFLGPLGYLDFGITERLGLARNPNRSQPIGPQSTSPIAPQSRSGATTLTTLQSPQVLSTQAPYSPMQQTTSAPSSPSGGQAPTTNDGGGGGGSYVDPLEVERQNYINSLNSMYDPMLASLDPQRASQEGIVNTQYNQGVSNIQSQEQQGMADLATQERKVNENQKSTLQDLADNIRNMFTAGQVYLGARGAGDSSAANMYSYALNKQGSKQRGDVMAQSASMVNDIRDRESRLKNTVIQATQQLESEKNVQLQNIAQWFYDAQREIQGMKGQDLAALSKTMLENAIGRLNQIDTDYRNKRSALETWAMNNSTGIEQLKQNLSKIPGVLGQLPQLGQLSPLSMTGGQNFTGVPGIPTQEKRDIYGNIIR